MRFLLLCLLALIALAAPSGAWAGGLIREDALTVSVPTPEQAQEIFAMTRPPLLLRQETPVPGWSVNQNGKLLGHIASTWEVAGSVGYSGRPIDILVGVTAMGRIAGARLMRHSEPILTLGLSDGDIARFVGAFAGLDLTAPRPAVLDHAEDLPDVISRATVSSGVIRDSILRTARTVAIGNGLIAGGGGIDRVTFVPKSWNELADEGALGHSLATLSEARAALAVAKTPPPEGEGAFLDLWVALLDPPGIGRNLLGQQGYTAAIGALGPGELALFVASRGLQTHRGSDWLKTGEFDRITVIQGANRFVPKAEGFRRIDRLAAEGAPDFKERSVFHLPATGFDPAKPFRIEVRASRPAATGEVSMVIGADYQLPQGYILAAPAEPEPLWQAIWRAKLPQTVSVAVMLVVLAGILFFQESFVRRPRLWRWGRIGFLSVTFLWLGWGLNGQLSVVQVVAFVQSLLTGFRWETFLIEPVIFLIWSFVALGLLFWGRGVYCGWLCPFGALQELTNTAAQALGVKQIAVPQALHERLWAIKYTLFVAILALSFYSMSDALVLAEAEPFKTAISLRFLRAWPFVLFVLAILVAGLFIERFYCRYLCPLGAGLAIPAKLKIFDWLKRRPQCGRECRLCEQKCTVGAIDPLGRINPNECVLCLRCQVIFHDPTICTVLKRRARPTIEGAKP